MVKNRFNLLVKKYVPKHMKSSEQVITILRKKTIESLPEEERPQITEKKN